MSDPIELARRALADHWEPNIRDVAHDLARAVLALAKERDELRERGPLWMRYAIAKMHTLVDQTDPNDHVGHALTLAGLERVPSVPEFIEIDSLRAQLTALRAALREACGIHDRHMYPWPCKCAPRIAALRKIAEET